jgi:hypothetical protein
MKPHTNISQEASVARFALGQTVITPGSEEALQIAGQTAPEFLRRHSKSSKRIVSELVEPLRQSTESCRCYPRSSL